MVVSRSMDQIGRVLSDRYRLIAPIGTGASAQVYLADDVRLRRRVAVKILHEALASDESFLRRFRAEAQAAAALNHPNVVAVYDWGEHEGAPYIVTEYLGGGSLRSMLDRGARLTPSQALLVGLEAARALDYAHRRGFVHRDIKPANLLYGEDGRLRVADFGLARALAEAAWTEPQGAVLGTARYASPEQAQGQALDGRADVYALGLVLIEAVTGSVPFVADTTIGTLMARVGHDVEVPDAAGPLSSVLAEAGRADPAVRLDAGGMGAGLMGMASKLPRPEPLPLAATTAPLLEDEQADGDRTVLTTEVGTDDAAPPASSVFVDDEASYVELDEPAPKRRRRWLWVVLLLTLAAIGGAAGTWLYQESQVPSFAVPVVVDLEIETAVAAIEQVDGAAWDIERIAIRRDGTTAGQVLETDPSQGEMLRQGGRLQIIYSEGNKLADVPQDLPGMTLEEAEAALAQAGDFTAVVSEEPSEEITEGTVIRLGEDVGLKLPKESDVALVVSSGPPPRTIPGDIVGGTFKAVEDLLKDLGLVAERVEEFHDTIPAGQVIGTRPASGQEAERDSSVEVVISKGPDLVKVPSVNNKTLQEATAALESAGLSVGNVYGPANGRPFSTDPEQGASVKRGTTVDIFLRR